MHEEVLKKIEELCHAALQLVGELKRHPPESHEGTPSTQTATASEDTSDLEAALAITCKERKILQAVYDGPMSYYKIGRRTGIRYNSALRSLCKNLLDRGLMERVPVLGVRTSALGKRAMQVWAKTQGP